MGVLWAGFEELGQCEARCCVALRQSLKTFRPSELRCRMPVSILPDTLIKARGLERHDDTR